MCRILLLLLMTISTLCCAEEISEQLKTGYRGILWCESAESAQAFLKKNGTEFSVATSEYVSDESHITFSEGDIKIRLTFYKNMLMAYERSYLFPDPDNHSMDYWREKVMSATKDVNIDKEDIGVTFSVPASFRTSGLGKTETTINFSLKVHSKKIVEMQELDRKRRIELREKREAEVVSNIIKILADPNKELKATEKTAP